LHADTSLGNIRGIFVAQSIKPQARVLAESRGMGWCEVDYDELRGKRTDELRLF
jgi:RecB family endonuclease NucS